MIIWKWRTGEDDIEVVANDLSTELEGRIESGGSFGIVAGGFGTTLEFAVGKVFDVTWLALNEAWRGKDCMEYLEEVVNALLLGESINVFVRPAIVKLRRKVIVRKCVQKWIELETFERKERKRKGILIQTRTSPTSAYSSYPNCKMYEGQPYRCHHESRSLIFGPKQTAIVAPLCSKLPAISTMVGGRVG